MIPIADDFAAIGRALSDLEKATEANKPKYTPVDNVYVEPSEAIWGHYSAPNVDVAWRDWCNNLLATNHPVRHA